MVICAATNPFGMSWERDNTILFGQPDGIMRVSANGGTPELVIRAEKGEQVHGPQMLPDGESVLFSVTRATGDTRWDQADIVVQSLRTGQRTVVLKGGSDARYVPSGHLVYALGDGLFAVAFDANRREVQGGPVSVIEGVMRAAGAQVTTAAANYGISNQGTLVYATGGQAPRSNGHWYGWTARGKKTVIPAPPRAYWYPRLSPDGTRVALDIARPRQDIWIWDLARQTLTRLTFDPTADNYPVWSPGQPAHSSLPRHVRGHLTSTGRRPTARARWSASPRAATSSSPRPITPDGTEILFRRTSEVGGQMI